MADWKQFYEAHSDEANFYKMPPDSFGYFKRLYRYWLVQRYLNKYAAPACRLLDAGCGFGYSSILAAKGGFKPVALDIALPRLEELRNEARKYKGDLTVDIVCGDISTKSPFRDHAFGAIVCEETLEHLADVDSVLGEFCRTISYGGILVLAVPYKETLTQNICPRCGFRFHPAGHVHSFDLEKLRNLLSEHSFEPVYSFVFMNRFAFTMRRLRFPFSMIKLFDALLKILPRLRGSHIVVIARSR